MRSAAAVSVSFGRALIRIRVRQPRIAAWIATAPRTSRRRRSAAFVATMRRAMAWMRRAALCRRATMAAWRPASMRRTARWMRTTRATTAMCSCISLTARPRPPGPPWKSSGGTNMHSSMAESTTSASTSPMSPASKRYVRAALRAACHTSGSACSTARASAYRSAEKPAPPPLPLTLPASTATGMRMVSARRRPAVGFAPAATPLPPALGGRL
mmetsp:Transcript_19044/g.59097  ORF Transcript_19044/g.59097 Transcript_19044/m.59097 type:complete len:214 (+) Transcript_19044:243-884(+)